MKLPEKKKSPVPVPPTHEVPQTIMERVGFLLNRSTQRMREFSDEALKPYQLSGRHMGVLTTIHEKGSVPQNEIGHCIHIDRTTMVDIIDDLENKGLVERKENPVDRRAYALTLTAKGKDILPKVQKLGLEAERKFLAHLAPKEQKDLIQLLQKLVKSHFQPAKP